jgi:chromate transporter
VIYLKLFWEFFKTGLFAVGGGMATLPFLKAMGEANGWFTDADLMNMLAVSESTPGPIGINMATYVGYTIGGVPGGVIATIGEVTPSIIVILLIAAVLQSFKNHPLVGRVFYGLRPASAGLISAACVGVALQVLTGVRTASEGAVNVLTIDPAVSLLNWKGLVLAAVLLVLTNRVKVTRNLHPIVFIGLSAVVGMLFCFAGV